MIFVPFPWKHHWPAVLWKCSLIYVYPIPLHCKSMFGKHMEKSAWSIVIERPGPEMCLKCLVLICSSYIQLLCNTPLRGTKCLVKIVIKVLFSPPGISGQSEEGWKPEGHLRAAWPVSESCKPADDHADQPQEAAGYQTEVHHCQTGTR